MDIKKDAREAAAEARQQQKHLEETSLERAKEAVEAQSDKTIQAEMRELSTQKRQKQEHLQENVLSRAEEAIEKAAESSSSEL